MNKKSKIAVIGMFIYTTLIILGTNSMALSAIYRNNDDTYKSIAGKIIGLAQFICYAAAVIILLYKGVGLMNKAPEAKADAKKELIAYAVGAFILFGIGSIIRIIGGIAMGALFFGT